MPAVIDFKGGGAKGWHKFQLAGYKKLVEMSFEQSKGVIQDPTLRFDKVTHTYSSEQHGKIDSVTTILKSVGLSPGMEYVSDEALWRGSRNHKLFELASKDNIDETSLDEEMKLLLGTYRRFLHETRAEILASEVPLVDYALEYAGTPDLVVKFADDRSDKVTVHVLEITPEKYTLTPFYDYWSERVFASAMIVHHARKQMGLTKAKYVV